ncbi:uncharacterized protein V1516DRAFT_652269 [Lipomyces oligophaga]|uniref:uncharacterized protein n=1 Tax=Lipomyces oligophaga TaxID=45792 RepID=UPI0034CDE641
MKERSKKKRKTEEEGSLLKSISTDDISGNLSESLVKRVKLERDTAEPVSKSKKTFHTKGLSDSLDTLNGSYKTYLYVYAHDRPSWKFSKPKQNWVLRHLHNFSMIPESWESILLSYLEGLPIGSARMRVIADAKKIVAESAAPTGEGSEDVTGPESQSSHLAIARANAILDMLEGKSDSTSENFSGESGSSSSDDSSELDNSESESVNGSEDGSLSKSMSKSKPGGKSSSSNDNEINKSAQASKKRNKKGSEHMNEDSSSVSQSDDDSSNSDDTSSASEDESSSATTASESSDSSSDSSSDDSSDESDGSDLSQTTSSTFHD